MVMECLNAFEQGLDIIDKKISGQPRQEVMLSRMQFIIFKKLHEIVNQSLQPYDINDTMLTPLMMLYFSPSRCIYPSDLSNIVISSRANITRFADEMVKKGWVSRKGHEIDRRKTILTLTDEGAAFIESALPRQCAIYQVLWQDFSDAEKNLMEAMQHKLLASIIDFDDLPEPLIESAVCQDDVTFMQQRKARI